MWSGLKRSFFLSCLFSVVLPLYSPSAVHAQSVNITGKIEDKTAISDNTYELKVSHKQGKSNFRVDQRTMIQALVSAGEVEVGNEIFVSDQPRQAPPATGVPGHPQAGQRQIKKPSDIPKIPKVPKLPKATKVPKVPKTPNQGGKPPPAESPAKGQGGAPAGGMMQPMPEGMGGAPGGGGKGGAPRKKPDEPPPVPGADPLADASAKSLFKPGGADKPQSAKPLKSKVLATAKKGDKVELKIEAKDGRKGTILVSAAQPMRQSISANDLQKNMSVRVEALDDSPESIAQTITVI